MSPHTIARTGVVLVAAMAMASAWVWWHLPADAQVAIHFNADGVADGWASPGVGLFLLPGVALATLPLLIALPRLDPRGANLLRSAPAYGAIAVASLALLACVHALILAKALAVEVDMARSMVFLLGALWLVIGNYLGKLRWNYTVGIRTPWTLASERVWDRTHRFGGHLFFACGLALVAAALAGVPTGWYLPLILWSSLGAPLVAVVKSYLLWRAER